MDKEYQGCIYDRPGQVRRSELDLTRDELNHIVTQLPSTPVVLDHDLGLYAGVVTKAWQEPRTGSAYVSFCLDPHSEVGRVAHHRIKNERIRGLSLSHFPSTLKPREVSICSQGARPNTGIINASINPKPSVPIPADVRVIPAPEMADPVAPMNVDGTASASAMDETKTDEELLKAAAKKKKKTSTDEADAEAGDESEHEAEPVGGEDLLAKYFDNTAEKMKEAAASASAASLTASSGSAVPAAPGGLAPMDTDADYQEFLRFKAFKEKNSAAAAAAQAASAKSEPVPPGGPTESKTKAPAQPSAHPSHSTTDPAILSQLKALQEQNDQHRRLLVDARLDRLLARWKANGVIDNSAKSRESMSKFIEKMRKDPEAISELDTLLSMTTKRVRSALPKASKAESADAGDGKEMTTQERAARLMQLRQAHAGIPSRSEAGASSAKGVSATTTPLNNQEVPVNASLESQFQAKHGPLVGTQLARLLTYEPHTHSLKCYPVDSEKKIWTMDPNYAAPKPRASAATAST